ncbi:DNA repair protein RecO [Aliiglaciecola sp. 3_MG-2023]|uniref:DNA repair protein RecO n=1 Tax=Aliiglaciecola sp. 3_MG-2023 TaxID=3062644 RepID=UPI0026E3C760|nr:DNA repair protein RecO [Aliiglaciecola sp. 3_MG-2023]MDO6692845.1 DNA repair protein RecO [Aliiglaciecola sp. 3_MG-2023]
MAEPNAMLNGLVLHRREYRETSFIVDFFTKQQGRVSAICRGVRGGKSTKSNEKKSLIQPFQPLLVSFSGRHELKNLTQIEGDARAFLLNGPVLFSAMYLNELLNRVLPKEVSYPEVYDLYMASLLRLAKQESIEVVLREFEISLINNIGYGFDWQADCHTGDKLESNSYYSFINDHGFQRLNQVQRTANCFLGKDLENVARFIWDKQSLLVAKRVTRMAFKPILGEKPLKSRELFIKLERTE